MKLAILCALTAFATSQCLAASLQARQADPVQGFPIYHAMDMSKCVGLQGPLENGTPVVLADCNIAAGEFTAFTMDFTTPTSQIRVAGTDFCLDTGETANTGGNNIKIWQCFDNLPVQQWTYVKFSQRLMLSLLRGVGLPDLCLSIPRTQLILRSGVCTSRPGSNDFQIWQIPAEFLPPDSVN